MQFAFPSLLHWWTVNLCTFEVRLQKLKNVYLFVFIIIQGFSPQRRANWLDGRGRARVPLLQLLLPGCVVPPLQPGLRGGEQSQVPETSPGQLRLPRPTPTIEGHRVEGGNQNRIIFTFFSQSIWKFLKFSIWQMICWDTYIKVGQTGGKSVQWKFILLYEPPR